MKNQVQACIAEVFALLNDDSSAMRYLVQAIEQGQVLNYQIANSLIFEDLRKLRRYKILQAQQKRAKDVVLSLDEYFL